MVIVPCDVPPPTASRTTTWPPPQEDPLKFSLKICSMSFSPFFPYERTLCLFTRLRKSLFRTQGNVFRPFFLVKRFTRRFSQSGQGSPFQPLGVHLPRVCLFKNPQRHCVARCQRFFLEPSQNFPPPCVSSSFLPGRLFFPLYLKKFMASPPQVSPLFLNFKLFPRRTDLRLGSGFPLLFPLPLALRIVAAFPSWKSPFVPR